MASSVDSHSRSSARPANRGKRVAAGIVLSLALAAGGGAIWIFAAQRPSPWEEAFADLGETGEACRGAGDATADATGQMARSHGQLDNFVRQRFDQLLADAKLAQEQFEREATARAAAARAESQAEAARLDARLADLTVERSRLLVRLTHEHPLVADLDRQIADLERERAAFAQTISHRTVQETEIAPAAAWKETVARSVVEYDQFAAACRRAERQFDEAQAGHATAIDHHLTTVERWSDDALDWGQQFGMHAAAGSGLWALAAAALALVGWLAARNRSAGALPSTDRLLTTAGDIERSFSLPVVAVSAFGDEKPAAFGDEKPSMMAAGRRSSPWLVLPAQFAVAVAVFCLVAVTIRNPSWFELLWNR